MRKTVLLAASVSLLTFSAGSLPGSEPTERPLLHYTFDDISCFGKNSGTAANGDAEAHLLSKHSSVPGVRGGAIMCTGMADSLHLSDPARIIPNACTISFYLRPEHMRERMTAISFYGNDNRIIGLDIVKKHLAFNDYRPPESRLLQTCGPELELDRFYHVIWRMDGKYVQIYLDGKEVFKQKYELVPSDIRPQRMNIATDYHSVVAHRYRLVGTLDDLQIHCGAPSADFIARQSQLLTSAPPKPPVVRIYNTVIKETEPVKSRITADQQFVFDGKKEPVMLYGGGGFLPAASYSLRTLPDASRAGMNVFRYTVDGKREFCGGTWWYGPDKYDFDLVDRNLDFAFRQNPNVKIILSLPASPPAWWGEQNPGELCSDFYGRTNQDYFASHSYSSKKWLEDLEKAWTALFEHMKKQPYYKRIIGITPVSGRYGECLRAGYNSQLYGKELTDYSQVELRAFRQWLKQRYGTMENMRKAYKTGSLPATIDEVKLPSPGERQRPDSSYFRDGVVDRLTLDYITFVNEQSAQAVCDFTAILRKLAGPDKLIGLYYGYLLEDALGHNRAWAGDSGHFGLDKVLRSDSVDFLAAPVGYTQRQLGCVGPSMGPAASLALHNKLWVYEADIRTSLNGGKAEYSGASNLDESLAVLWRTYGNTVIDYSGMWWVAIHGKKSYDDPAIWSAFATMYQDMAQHTAVRSAERRKRAVALIVDPVSINFRRYSLYDPLCGNLLTLSRDVFAKSGIEYDYYSSGDLGIMPDDYPVYIFLNSFYLTDEARATIEKRFKKDGKLLVWCYGAGYFQSTDPAARIRTSVKNMQSLSGIQMEVINSRPMPLDSRPAPGYQTELAPLSLKGKYKPIFAVNDPQAQKLALFTAPELAEKTAAAYKNCGSYQSIYLGTPEFKTAWVRAIARLGKAHVYTDAENVVVRAGNDHIMIHSGHDDTVNIFLPEKVSAVIRVDNGQTVARLTDKFSIKIGKNRTILLRIKK